MFASDNFIISISTYFYFLWAKYPHASNMPNIYSRFLQIIPIWQWCVLVCLQQPFQKYSNGVVKSKILDGHFNKRYQMDSLWIRCFLVVLLQEQLFPMKQFVIMWQKMIKNLKVFVEMIIHVHRSRQGWVLGTSHYVPPLTFITHKRMFAIEIPWLIIIGIDIVV